MLHFSVWFAVIASLGVQGALVFVAWLIGLTKGKRFYLLGQEIQELMLESLAIPGLPLRATATGA